MADLGSTKVFGDLTVAGDIRIGGASGNMTAPDFIQSSAQSTNAAACTRKDYVDSAIAAGDALQVSKSGDTMTGNLTAPKVLVSDAQGTEVNALTRKDYVDAELAKKLNLTGGTLTGNLTAPAVLVSSAQNTSANALTRKDYVDTELSKKLSLTGGTMTGALYVNEMIQPRALSINDISSGARLVITPQGDSERFTIDMYPASSSAYQVIEFKGSDRTVSFKQIVSCDAAPVAATHLTRKDYVDSQVATRAPTAHTHTVAAITDLRPQDANATASTLVLRDGSADVNARLLRTTYSDESTMSGAIAFRVNNSTNNYTRYCNNPESVRNWMKGAKTDWQMGWRAYIEHADNPMTEYHIPGKTAVITYLTGDGNYRITSSNGAGGAVADRLRIDSSGNLFTQAAIHEAGQRVYSPNNPPPKFAYQFQGERWVGDSIPLTNGAEIVLTEDVRGRMGRSQILDNGMNVQVMMQFPVIDSIFSVAQGNDHTVFELYGYGRRLKRLRGWGEGGPWQGFWVFT